MEQYIKNLTKRWIFAVLDVQLHVGYVDYNRFYKRRFLHLYL